jgi:NAD(P)-dependent dehydrogenase (short-subunit alcohol dehydrogenase family)
MPTDEYLRVSSDSRKVMLVTGGSGSIGFAIAQRAAAAGWEVALHGRTKESALGSVERIRCSLTDTSKIEPFCADIAAGDTAERLVEMAGSWRGRLDAVVDCVSMGPKHSLTGVFSSTDPQGYLSLMDLSVVHFQRLALASLPWLSREGGALIAFASDAGRFAAPGQSIIGTSRAAIMGFVRNLATEVSREGIRVHCISPSFVDQSRVSVRLEEGSAKRFESLRQKAGLGLPTPVDIAPLAIFLCGDDARYITGQIISINGGANA